jgi:lysophospholipase L1-like esterase
MLTIKKNSTILFQGDSITDADRQRDNTAPNSPFALGSGYVNHIASHLLMTRPADSIKFLNRGISGNRIVDLYSRWKSDAINLKPDVISILIGVNDTWHEFNDKNGVEPERFRQVYRMMLEYTKEKLPDVQLVLCEPFVLKCGVVGKAWIAEMDQRREIVRKLATDFSAVFVPFQAEFDTAEKSAPALYWLMDGVHPTPAGHQRMADCWMKTAIG